ncbi:MAG: shikimate kinase [Clostridia bacterium]|nr:shikimate kinase [Clostridia bacterium]
MMKKFGLLGRKLGHSFSPQIHRHLGDYEYLLYEKEPEDVEAFVKNSGLDGFNVTIPYKQTVMPFCDDLSETAQKIGSVNTVVYRNGKIEGHNTDYYGFTYMLKSAGIDPKGKKSIILGAGGASKTVSAVLRDMGAASVTFIDLNLENNYTNIDRHYDAEIIINATPVGMYPHNGSALVELANFPRCRGVADLIYNPSRTKFILDAEALGLKHVNGLSMLVTQAKRAAELFLDCRLCDSLIPEIIRKIERETKNIALIGMPGCGKSSIGKVLSNLTGRELIETDLLIPEKAGKSIEAIFAEDGEDAFRAVETAVLAEVSKLSGKIISTGGGVVTRQENYALLHQNSTIVFLSRDLSLLPISGRPLSCQNGVEALAEKRLPLYNAWCDYAVECTGVKKTAYTIKNHLLPEDKE